MEGGLPVELLPDRISFASFYELLLVFGLASIRLIVLLSFLPIFTELALPMPLRLSASLALSAPLLPTVDLALTTVVLSSWDIFLLVAKEALVGVILLLIIGLPFWAIDMAGDVVEIQRGMGNEALTDPSDLVQSQPTGRLFFLLFLLFVITSGGFLTILDVIYSSFDVISILQQPNFTSLIASLLESNFLDDLFDFAIVMILPVMLFILMVDTAIAVISRFGQQLNVLQLSLVVKGLVALGGLAFYGSLLHAPIESNLVDIVVRFQGLRP